MPLEQRDETAWPTNVFTVNCDNIYSIAKIAFDFRTNRRSPFPARGDLFAIEVGFKMVVASDDQLGSREIVGHLELAREVSVVFVELLG